MNLRDKAAKATRVKLVAATQHLFARDGFGAVGIRTIAEEAGVSTGSVFHKWPTKEALFEDAIGRDWPDPAAFARFILLRCNSMEEAREGAAIFLADVAGANRGGMVKIWSPRREA